MGTFLGYRCSVCAHAFNPDEATYDCPHDGGNLDVLLDIPAIQAGTSPGALSQSKDHSIWRYLPLLPVDDPGLQGTLLRTVGWTPLLKPARLASNLSLKNLWLKDDGRNPTASFKDRASAVAVVRARELGAEMVITASSGNAGAALAGMAAAVGQPSVILVPKAAPRAKVAQLLMFGADVFLVDGNYDDAFDLTLEASQSFGWYCRNTGYNPFTAEGKKTAAFEITEQFSQARPDSSGYPSRWIAPDALFVSVGDGNIIAGIHKGFKDLVALGWIEQAPRLYGVQASGASAVFNAFSAGSESIEAVRANTVADSISVDLPRDGLRALRAATQTGGVYLAVSDQEILQAMRDMARHAAVFAEPAGATAYAGLVMAVSQGLVAGDEHILVLNTGNGLKDVDSAMRAAGEAPVIEARLDALRDALRLP